MKFLRDRTKLVEELTRANWTDYSILVLAKRNICRGPATAGLRLLLKLSTRVKFYLLLIRHVLVSLSTPMINGTYDLNKDILRYA